MLTSERHIQVFSLKCFSFGRIVSIMGKSLIGITAFILLFWGCADTPKQAHQFTPPIETTAPKWVQEIEELPYDVNVIQFIKAKGEFVSLADSTELLKYMDQSTFRLLTVYLANNHFYISPSHIVDNTETIAIPVFHYNGFVREKELEEKNEKARINGGSILSITGNMSGNDGNVVIDKVHRRVKEFGVWQ